MSTFLMVLFSQKWSMGNGLEALLLPNLQKKLEMNAFFEASQTALVRHVDRQCLSCV